MSRQAGLIICCFLTLANAEGIRLLTQKELKAPGAWSLPSYTLCTKFHFPELGDEGSGLTFHGQSNTFWAVSRDPVPSIHELSHPPQMRHLRTIALDVGMIPDPEGVAWVGGQELVVVCEETGNIARVNVGAATPPPENQGPPAMWSAPQDLIANLQGIKHKKNDFLEGVTFNFRTKSLLVAQERKPKQILRVGLEGQGPEVVFSLEEPPPGVDDILDGEAGEERKKKGKRKNRKSQHPVGELIKDVSGLEAAPDGSLFLLSQASNCLVKVDPQGRLLESIEVDLPFPEGVAFSLKGDFLVILSEGESGREPSTVAVYSTELAFCSE